MRLTTREWMTVLVLAVAVPSIASAQTSAAQPRWFVGGLGGVTFGTVSDGAFAGQAGITITKDLFAIAEVGRMQNVLPSDLRDELDDLIKQAELEFGVPITLEYGAPATYFFGGIRWVPQGRTVAPFLEAGAGVGHITLSFSKVEIFGIDVTDELEEELGAEETTTEFLLAIGGGINARLSPSLSIDAGYRFTRIATDDPAINTSMIYAALKFGR
jgi:hypothetical protein